MKANKVIVFRYGQLSKKTTLTKPLTPAHFQLTCDITKFHLTLFCGIHFMILKTFKSRMQSVKTCKI